MKGVNELRDRIEIEKELLPYSFEIDLKAAAFEMEFMYNSQCGIFTVTLSKEGEILVSGEPVIYGVPLFQDVYIPGVFPILKIVPIDESGIENKITYDNFNVTVFLTIDEGDDSDG